MKSTLTLAVLVSSLALGYARADEGKKVTLTGEIIDLSCYFKGEEMGKAHAACAKACLKKGESAGLLGADGNVTLLIENHDFEKAFKNVRNLGGSKATVTGVQNDKGGLKALVVSEAEKAK